VPGSPGRPLDPATRAFMEPRFGHDFSRVRVHADALAAESAAAMEAAAYTVGHDVVFGAGQYAPETSRGRSLLAHELAHVVNPALGWLSRSPDTDKEKKEKAIVHHEKQQTLVAGYLKAALKLARHKDPLHEDNLYRNAAELLETPRPGRALSLTVFTGTHYSTDARPVYFDADVQHPKVGGDYPPDKDPNKPPVGRGLVTEKPETAGRFQLAPSMPTYSPTVKKEETTVERVSPSTKPTKSTAPPPAPRPAPAPPPAVPFTWSWQPGEMRVFWNDLTADLSEARFKNIFVHEGQHAADLMQRTLDDPNATNAQKVLAHYQSEFRAFWIQPVVPVKREKDVEPIGVQAIENLPAKSTTDAASQRTITASCPCDPPPKTGSAPAPVSTSVKTALKHQRQKVIFDHLLANYPNFQCFYVCDAAFKKSVDDFAFPVGVNVVNSQRLLELNLRLQDLNTGMKPADVAQTNFRQAVLDLDSVDWAFLKDTKLSAAFWTDLDARAPKAVVAAMKTSAKAGKVDVKALDKATVP
jgi:hypothetical protein